MNVADVRVMIPDTWQGIAITLGALLTALGCTAVALRMWVDPEHIDPVDRAITALGVWSGITDTPALFHDLRRWIAVNFTVMGLVGLRVVSVGINSAGPQLFWGFGVVVWFGWGLLAVGLRIAIYHADNVERRRINGSRVTG